MLSTLAIAVTAFVASHVVLSSLPIRTRLTEVLGENGFRAGYSLLAMALLVWVIFAYNTAPVVDLWVPPVDLRRLALVIMLFACIFLVAGFSTANPTVVGADTAAQIAQGPKGIFRITRHPVMWAIGLWSLAHLLANGDAAGMILFAGMGVLAIGGAINSDQRRLTLLGEHWIAYRAHTSFVPFAAILMRRTPLRPGEIGWARFAGGAGLFALLLIAHPWLFGVSPLQG